MRLLVVLFSMLLGCHVVAPVAVAQDQFPAKALRLVVPLPPGGPTDYLARLVARNLALTLNQPVVVDNKPGADGLIAVRDVVAAPADGHTLLFATGSMTALPLLTKTAGFEWQTTLAPVGKVGRISFALMVHPDVPAKSVAELIAHARAFPDRLNFSSSTLGELMVAAQFMQATGTRLTRVPYKGGAQALPDLLAGRIQIMFGPVTLAQAHLKTGALRVLATVLPQRSGVLPAVPTLAEGGYPGVAVPAWQALFAPARTPAPVIGRLATDLKLMLARPDVRADLEQRAIFVEPSTPQELAAAIEREQTAWQRLIGDYKLSAD